MDLGLGLNLNSFMNLPQDASAGRFNPGASGDASGESFQSQMKSQSQEAGTQGFNGKPMPTPGEAVLDPTVGFFPSASVDQVLPQPRSSQPEEGLSATQSVKQQKVDVLTRRVAWQKFLQKMKSELGVSAEDILKAFQSLTPQELQQPPEKNVAKLVETLGLNPEQSQTATQLFQNLLQRTGSRPLAQELKVSKRDINLSVMSQREQEQKKLSESLEKMNQRFFMKPSESKAEHSSPVAAAAPAVNKFSTETLQSGKEVSPDLLAQMQPVTEEESNELLKRLAQEVQAPASAPVEQQAHLATPSSLVSSPVESVTGQEIDSPEPENDALTRAVERVLASSSELKPQTKVSSKAGAKDADLFSSGGQTGQAAFASVENLSESVVDRSTFTEALSDAGIAVGQKEAVSTEDLIQQAHTMIRDGGGEVKVILEPEGLGEVAMKVSVDGDKVQVEMVTESDAAKRMLEKGMGDLKTHLHASNLNLESIKVDTASELGQQLEQQYQDAQRQHAQQFMEQFRQGNQEFRRGFFDLPGAKLYQSQTKAEAPEVEASRSGSAKQGRHLNLVA